MSTTVHHPYAKHVLRLIREKDPAATFTKNSDFPVMILVSPDYAEEFSDNKNKKSGVSVEKLNIIAFLKLIHSDISPIRIKQFLERVADIHQSARKATASAATQEQQEQQQQQITNASSLNESDTVASADDVDVHDVEVEYATDNDSIFTIETDDHSE